MKRHGPYIDSTIRLLSTLLAIPVGRWATTQMIHSRLVDRGFDVSERTVQRDLKKLAEKFPIDVADNRGGQHGSFEWRRLAKVDP